MVEVLPGLRLRRRLSCRLRVRTGAGLLNVMLLAYQQLLWLVKVRSLFEYSEVCQSLLIEFGQPELNPCPLARQRRAQAGSA